jgi:hypothetical protein
MVFDLRFYVIMTALWVAMLTPVKSETIMTRGGMFCHERVQIEEQVERLERYNGHAPLVDGCNEYRRDNRVPAVITETYEYQTREHIITIARIVIHGIGPRWGYRSVVLKTGA